MADDSITISPGPQFKTAMLLAIVAADVLQIAVFPFIRGRCSVSHGRCPRHRRCGDDDSLARMALGIRTDVLCQTSSRRRSRSLLDDRRRNVYRKAKQSHVETEKQQEQLPPPHFTKS